MGPSIVLLRHRTNPNATFSEQLKHWILSQPHSAELIRAVCPQRRYQAEAKAMAPSKALQGAPASQHLRLAQADTDLGDHAHKHPQGALI